MTEDPRRDLEAAIARYILGWGWTHVGRDCDGKNECDILCPPGWSLPNGYSYPPRGKPHIGFWVPRYCGELHEALKLANTLRATWADGVPTDPKEVVRVVIGDWLARYGEADSPLRHTYDAVFAKRPEATQ